MAIVCWLRRLSYATLTIAGLDDELLSLAATKSKELQLKVEGMSHADNDGTQDKGPANEAKEDERADEEPEMTHAEAEDAMDEGEMRPQCESIDLQGIWTDVCSVVGCGCDRRRERG